MNLLVSFSASAVGAAIGCIAGVLLIVLIVVLIVEKRRKDGKKNARIYDDVPPAEDRSYRESEFSMQMYENMHAHSNAGFVGELTEIIGKTAQGSPKVNRSEIKDKTFLNGSTAKEETKAACEDSCYEDSEPMKNEHLEKDHPKAEENIYCLNANEQSHSDKGIVGKNANTTTRDIHKEDDAGESRKPADIDLDKAQLLYENAAFPVKYSRIATPRICERSLQEAKKGKVPNRKGQAETVEPVLQKLERPKIAVRRNPSVVSESDLIYDDVPDETAENEEPTTNNGPVKPPIKPKPRLSKILRHKNKAKTPSPRLKSVDGTVMVDNEVYTAVS